MFGTIMTTAEPIQNRDSSLNKRRRFAPDTFPVIASSDNSSILNHNHDSPLLLQLCDQSPSQQEIEAQLLEVGMRIRKPVNEATTTGRRAFTPRPFFNSHRLSPDTLSALTNNSNMNDANSSAGGLPSQPISTATFCGINLAVMAHISTSTPIAEQKLWSYSTASKRRQFDEDSDSEDSQEFMPRTPQLEFADAQAELVFPQDYFNISTEDMNDDTPIAYNQTTQPRAPTHNRKMAQPKSRLRAVPEHPVMPVINPFVQVAPARAFGSHQRMRSCGMEAGEPIFMQLRQDVEMDCS